MRGSSRIRFASLFALAVFAAAQVWAGQVVSSTRNVNAVMQAQGFYLAPATNVQVGYNPRDLAPVQSFELVRPNWEKVTIGRLYTSCTCVQLETTKRTFERGERAVFNLHNFIPTPANGQNYAIYVQITGPIRTILRYDTFVQSSQFITTGPIVVTEPETGEKTVAEDTTEKNDVLNTAEGGVQDKSAPTDEDEAQAAVKQAFEDKADETGDKTGKTPDHDKYTTRKNDKYAESGEEEADKEKADADVAEEAAEAASDADDAEETADAEPKAKPLAGEDDADEAIDTEVDNGDVVDAEDIVGTKDVTAPEDDVVDARNDIDTDDVVDTGDVVDESHDKDVL